MNEIIAVIVLLLGTILGAGMIGRKLEKNKANNRELEQARNMEDADTSHDDPVDDADWMRRRADAARKKASKTRR